MNFKRSCLGVDRSEVTLGSGELLTFIIVHVQVRGTPKTVQEILVGERDTGV